MRKLSHAALLPVPQSESPVAGLIWPVQVTIGFDSETLPEAGFDPRVIGITTTTSATTDTEQNAANRYLSRLIVETVFESASFLNIFRLSFVTIVKRCLV